MNPTITNDQPYEGRKDASVKEVLKVRRGSEDSKETPNQFFRVFGFL